MRILQGTGLTLLLAIVMLVTGCAALTYKDMIPQQTLNPPRTNPQYDGTVEIHAVIKPELMAFGKQYLDFPLKPQVDDVLLQRALKEAVADSAIFTRVEQKNADYVLDVWVDDLDNYAPGIGDYWARFFSIWRLTRARDGKVLVCEFVDGYGLINTMGSQPRQRSLFAALKDMNQNGLRVLADTSRAHLAAMSVAGIRPSMGSAVPEGLKAWEDNVRKNWPYMGPGLSLAEVEKRIGPVSTSGALVRIYPKYERTDVRVLYRTIKYTYADFPAKRWEQLTGYGEKYPRYDLHSYCYQEKDTKITYYITHLYALEFHESRGLQAATLW